LPHWWSYKDDSFALLALDEVRAHYPVDPDRVILTGYSMGGYGSWNIGLRYPDRFAAIAPHAGGISRRENLETRDERSRALLLNGKNLPSFFVHGGSDPVVPTRFSRTMAAELQGLGADVTYIEVPGAGHVIMSFLEGDEHLQQLKAWTAERVRDPHPRRIEHAAIGVYQGADRWIRIDGLTREAGRVAAEVKEDGRIVVDAQGVSALTVFIDPTLIPAGAPVRIEVNGAVVHEGVVAPSAEAVARSFAGRRDPSLVYTRAVRVTVPPVGDF
jgi:poly(3-hydroxybutyrate) depolymerase